MTIGSYGNLSKEGGENLVLKVALCFSNKGSKGNNLTCGVQNRRSDARRNSSIEVKGMKRAFLFTILLAGVLMVAPAMSQAGCGGNYGCPPTATEGSAETQAFENISVEYGQSAGVQDINQVTFKTEAVKSYEIEGNASGSIHTNPDILAFGNLSGKITETISNSTSVSCVDATVNTMNGNVAMVSDAGASAASIDLAGASSSAGNSGLVTQTQVLPFANGGVGTQFATVSGFTKVEASAGN